MIRCISSSSFILGLDSFIVSNLKYCLRLHLRISCVSTYCRSFGLNNSPTAVIDTTEIGFKEDVELEDEREVVLVEKVHDDGTVEKIVFASGVEVDVYELEILCDKVDSNLMVYSAFYSLYMCSSCRGHV